MSVVLLCIPLRVISGFIEWLLYGLSILFFFFFFFKQKTAYEMRISDWSSDVCSSDLATIPMVYAVSRVQKVKYAEIVATVSSKSVGPGTRKNIDEFTRTTAGAVARVGGADEGKAIIVIHPAEPPMLMPQARKSVEKGKRVSGRVAPGGGSTSKKK